ncbi:serine/threonine-protein phosphatase 7 long form homolog [Bidens hawaiensis]|uniref:serine/threonine-protein phosphatase 7 long form homolog n=1 Tax=Bidens hawaiensis TaxID=980011 RepID=UPI00404A54EB
MERHFTSGPLEDDLLFLSGNHIADYVFQQPKDVPKGGFLRVRRGDEKLWGYIHRNPITENVLHYIRMAGFAGVLECDNRRIDNALISALVERWRPETHTFHMPFGEVTVTLQDVEVLCGLRVYGNAVCDIDHHWNVEEIQESFFSLTGIRLENGTGISGQKINMPFILKCLMEVQFPENPSELQCLQRARTIIILLIGGQLFPENSSNWVCVKYLNHLQDLAACGELSWGSAVLSCLYRSLCKATNINTNEIAGEVFLLQLWAWERFPSTAPKQLRQTDWNKPLASRWQGPLTFLEASSHVLSAYRSEFNSYSEFQFMWKPYDDDLHILPQICRNGEQCWRSETYLICWEIVEPHIPSRVLRQFGMFQPIPMNTLLNVDEHKNLHNISRAGGRSGEMLVVMALIGISLIPPPTHC